MRCWLRIHDTGFFTTYFSSVETILLVAVRPKRQTLRSRSLVHCLCLFMRVVPLTFVHAQGFIRLLAMCCVLISPSIGADTAISDRLIVVDPHADTHLVQHTLGTAENLVSYTLPQGFSAKQLRQLDSGPHGTSNLRPDRVSITSGSVTFRHWQPLDIEKLEPSEHRLTIRSVPLGLKADLQEFDLENFASSQTWVFPSDVELLAWSSPRASTARVSGTWAVDGNTLNWEQRGLEAVILQITYRIEQRDTLTAAKTTSAINRDPAPSDEDKDGVPDFRDICLGATADEPDYVNELGCPSDTDLVLQDVRFRSGRSSLSLTARQQLNRVAEALLGTSEGRWEIAGFTDNAGAKNNNQALSARRAEAVRHYLILRGVPAGRLSARGYGEDSPIADNETTEGRSINRRIELRQWSEGNAVIQ